MSVYIKGELIVMSSRRQKKRTINLVLIVVALCFIVGASVYFIASKKTDVSDNSNAATETANTDVQQTQEAGDALVDDTVPQEQPSGDAGLSFADLAKYTYCFSSGAGAWADGFDIEKDGFFHGEFHDSDMGDTGDDYPNGTCYLCDYEGHFADIQRVDEYTCKMKLADIEVVGDKEDYIQDGVLNVISSPYALNNADEIDIYLPGKPTSEISEEILTWAGLNYGDDTIDKLEYPILVNVNENQGIAASDRMDPKEEAEFDYNNASDSCNYIDMQINSATSQQEKNELSATKAKAMDNMLNSIWILVKYNTDEDTFNKALEEQRSWLKDRDDKLKAYSKDGMDYNETLAKLTLDRCKDLLKYFN